jgi:hypothetical protein
MLVLWGDSIGARVVIILELAGQRRGLNQTLPKLCLHTWVARWLLSTSCLNKVAVHIDLQEYMAWHVSVRPCQNIL